MTGLSAEDDPTMRCAPPAFPRAAMLGHAIQIIQRPGFAFVFTEAYPVFRTIPTTGRAHTEEQYLYPTHMGDSTARWEGDTLVVDVTSFIGEGWLASPQDRPTNVSTGIWMSSDAMHVVERWRRIDADTLEYQATGRRSNDADFALGDPDGHVQTSIRRENRRVLLPPGGWPGDLSLAYRLASSALRWRGQF